MHLAPLIHIFIHFLRHIFSRHLLVFDILETPVFRKYSTWGFWLYLALPWSTSTALVCLDVQSYKWTGIGLGIPTYRMDGGWTSSLQSLLSPHNLLQLQGGQHSQHLRRKRQQTQLGYPHSCGSLWSTVCTGWKCNPRNMYLQTLDRVPAPWYQIQCNKFCRFISNKAQVYGCFNTELRSCVLVLSIAFVICKYRFIFKF